jgi:uncharacterized damage-inducible protein DinB
MFRKVNDFLETWKVESESTLKIFETLTDESLAQKVYEGGRTLGFIAKHITPSDDKYDFTTLLKINTSVKREDVDSFTTAKEIASAYKTASKEILDAVSKWKDEDLLEEVNMYGEMWKRGTSLHVLINHQTHHRGQMTVLMRQAGLKVPGVCGPSKEEWSQYNMPPQE